VEEEGRRESSRVLLRRKREVRLRQKRAVKSDQVGKCVEVEVA